MPPTVLYYLKEPNGNLVDFDKDSGGYPYQNVSIPWFTTRKEEAEKRLESYIEMKLLPEGTQVYFVML